MNGLELANQIAIKKIVGDITSVEVVNLQQDSRKVTPGTAFFCVDGEYVDGHHYADKAAESGAVLFIASKDISSKVGDIPVIYVNDVKHIMAKLANHFYDYPSSKLNMIGVTGTNGKTTVTHLIEWIYRKNNQDTGIIGTIYRKVKDQIYPTINTTPDPLIMHETLNEMVKEQVSMCACEVSSHALFQGRIWGVDFNTAVFTNLTPDHLETHKTMEEYGTVKSLLFAQLGNTLKNGKARFGVINLDDPFAEKLIYRTSAELITYSLVDESAHFFAKNMKFFTDKTTFDLVANGEVFAVELPLVGDFNVANTLAAIAASFVNGIQIQDAVTALASFEGVSGRMQGIENDLGIQAIVDYAHTPDGLEKLIGTLKKLDYKKLMIMIGHDGGNRDNSIRPALGKLSLDNADYVVFTSVNPRNEDPTKIMTEMVADHKGENYEFVIDRKEAIYRMVELAEAGDLIVFCGKGHESLQHLDGVSIPFNEAEYVRQALAEKSETLKGINHE
ncbi:UDP-N-acetylmuramoylalanyl-D-glutamate--2,6-diaminopimelate ligase [Granulicatella balaenopterae]|uniref:UDP-N-acetylmuramyl-tripeptide synthetase n=1 Tax=Granulicatella balaenopterae TaxID=137733 RepID=A0A1H9ICB6_9LACT|nr:UDP-N-acetylmuramoyl-L-alanyl-D-glutamate--2,6-diaminopimelate ligase [Granulicatella balaenopterae]SEQ72371.1 UDP-N-acetylmuramoylalanyl-D-glutamate--2,6-diaminopimelate ligase [Granulicatella balaenopterae]